MWIVSLRMPFIALRTIFVISLSLMFLTALPEKAEAFSEKEERQLKFSSFVESYFSKQGITVDAYPHPPRGILWINFEPMKEASRKAFAEKGYDDFRKNNLMKAYLKKAEFKEVYFLWGISYKKQYFKLTLK